VRPVLWGLLIVILLWVAGATLCWSAFLASMQFEPTPKSQLYGVLGLGVALISAGLVKLWRLAIAHGNKNLI
jgi:divalent metal cation (Fe/Co/Zn/Cd) transporter